MVHITLTSLPRLSPINLTIVALSLDLLAKIFVAFWLMSSGKGPLSKGFTYLGDDYPQEWSVERPAVNLALSNSVHFDMETESGALEWDAATLGDGLVYLGDHGRPFSISMLHQLRCLSILRGELAEKHGANTPISFAPLAGHCLNYLKQMVLCRGDVQLELFQNPNNKDAVKLDGIYLCRDWVAVYDAVKRNREEHRRREAAEISHGRVRDDSV